MSTERLSVGRQAKPLPILDGHNDTLLRYRRDGVDPLRAFLDGHPEGHVDLARARAGGFAGGFFAIFIPNRPPAGLDFREQAPDLEQHSETGGRDGIRNRAAGAAEAAREASAKGARATGPPDGLPPPIDGAYAHRAAAAMAADLLRIEAGTEGALRVVRSVADLRTCLETGAIAAILHLEGAEPIDTDLDTLELWVAAGLRSIGPVWSRANAFAEGVPFRMASPDTGPGLTEAGKRLVAACNRLGVMIDLSHLNEAGFWDVAEQSDAPLVATHSNAFEICPMTRNLTDRQLDAIRDSGGLTGLNFGVGFLREDAKWDADATLEDMVRHVDYMVARMGIEHVVIGSDFDGMRLPTAIGDVAGLPRLVDALRDAGYDEAALHQMGTGNWLRVLEATWKDGAG